ncbi:peroxidase family protein [Jiulongibacter sediminis]|uniref:peroxidase family protein n=1 Tax=Jiulongibacter sediminis TaxID=1605367 RepID=UPI0026EB5D22|nr:peroxidase family protein [Jiulongibacter sediminis]
MSKHHGTNERMWKLIERTCDENDMCHDKFGHNFGYLFGKGDTNTFSKEKLAEVAVSMTDSNQSPDLATPIGFAFLGQFIDHDITLDVISKLGEVVDDVTEIENLRTPRLELDSVYGSGKEGTPYLYDGDNIILGHKRNPKDFQRNSKGTAIIGDPRNDENLFINQLHSGFCQFHNCLLNDFNMTFEEAQQFVRWVYQKAIVEEFLTEVIQANIYSPIKQGFYNGQLPGPINWNNAALISVEFSAAAYRFGHSHVRNHYRLNRRKRGDLFDFGSFTPVKKGFNLDWKFFFNLDGHSHLKCRPIDTSLAADLFNLPFIHDLVKSLADRNLQRGQRTFGIRTGEDIAQNLFSIQPLPLHPKIDNAGLTETPLWFYILHEAEQGGGKLGQLGGTIVAGTLLNLLLKDQNSYVNKSPEFDPFQVIPKHPSGSILSSMFNLIN